MSMKIAECNARCKTCVYRTYVSVAPYDVACYYAVVVGHRRPCPAGKECTEYKKGRALKTTETLVVSRGGLRKCKACGREYMANSNNQRYCSDCYTMKRKGYKDAYYAKKKAIREAGWLKVDKTCTLCGKTYHSDTARNGLCPDCKLLSRHTKRKIRETQNETRRSE